jgi:hypothetical protein
MRTAAAAILLVALATACDGGADAGPGDVPGDFPADVAADEAAVEPDVEGEAPEGDVSPGEVVADAAEPPHALVLSGVTPGKGRAAGLETVSLAGDGFVQGMIVVFDQSASPTVIVGGPASATAITPPHSPGTVRVSIARPDGATAALDAAFTYANEVTIASIDPDHVPLGGGVPVTVRGSGFAEGAVLIAGGFASPLVTPVDDSTLLAVAPDGPAGTVDVLVATTQGQAVMRGGLTYVGVAPGSEGIALDAVEPASGPTAGGTPVALHGSGLAGATAVRFGAMSATSVVVESDEVVRAVTPPGIPGPVTVRVRRGDAEAAMPAGFAYEGPTALWAIDPDQGGIGGGTLVRLYGASLPPDARVFFGENEASHVVPESAGALSCRTPPGTVGAVDVRMTSGGDQWVLPQRYQYFDPTGLYGGTWGGPLDGTLNVSVLAAGSGEPLADAFVIVWTDPKTVHQGYTGPDGVVTFSGPDLTGQQMVSAGKDCYDAASVVAFDAVNVTLYLTYNCPSSGLPPPGVPAATVKGKVSGLDKYVIPPPGNCWYKWSGSSNDIPCKPCWNGDADCGGAGARCTPIGDNGSFCATPCATSDDCADGYACSKAAIGDVLCLPTAGTKLAKCRGTQGDVFSENQDPLPWAVAKADGSFEAFARPGTSAIVCVGGVDDPDTTLFTPYAMGVIRHVSATPGQVIEGAKVLLSLPMDRTFRVYFDDPPLAAGGPDSTVVIVYYDFAGDGVLQMDWLTPYSYQAPQVEVDHQPRAFTGDLYDVTYTFMAGAFTLDFLMNLLTTPYSIALRRDVSDLDDDTMFRLDASTWSVVKTGVRRDVYGMWGASGNDLFAVGAGGGVWYWDGFGFTQQPVIGGAATLRGVHGAAPDDAWAVGDQGTVARFGDTGWAAVDVPAAKGRDLRSVSCRATDDCWAVGWAFAMHFDGSAWTAVTAPYADFQAVVATGPQQAVAVASWGKAMLLTLAGGTPESPATGLSLYAATIGPGGDVWAVGDQGAMVRRQAGTWTALPTGTTKALHSVVASGDRVLAFGDAGVIVTVEDGAASVSRIEGYAPHLRAAWADPEGGDPALAMGISQLAVGPFLPPAHVVYPEKGGEMEELKIDLQFAPAPAASLQYLMVAIPGLMGDTPVWELFTAGDTTHVELPDVTAIEGLAGIPQGTPLKLTVLRVARPGAVTVDHFDYSDLDLLTARTWSFEVIDFVRP